MIHVVCGIIYNKRKIFIARRKKNKSLGGYWEFPGGKIEEGESESEALIRELKEELGMKVEVVKRMGAFIYAYEDFKLNLIGFHCNLIKVGGVFSDHDKMEWVTPAELRNYKFTEADLPFIEIIINAKNGTNYRSQKLKG
ncbi:(deoxy)nucleoside triphosphate pyrophosphohydrolase [Christiangramia sp.]|uniref:(deoxy)nucleoside triphosphate pyrophosphohydrolase n=1 Tax=Christiangramia sp. TaxID=1931228 RepID=UPI00261E2D38|nr:(deoxy)nucleoside triphosphate pyrophosphohydrolase [Christiangramia sp.]